MKMIGSKIEHPILVTLAALVLVFSAVGVEQAAAQEGLPRTPLIEQGPAVAPYNPPAVNNYIDVMLRDIVGFRFPVTRLEGKWKMSQNRTPKDREGVVKGLALRDRGDDREIAELVSRHTTPSDAGSQKIRRWVVTARSGSDEAIHSSRAKDWIASLRSQ